MDKAIHVAFCGDRKILQGIHVAAFSVLESFRNPNFQLHLHLFSNDISDIDLSHLKTTLDGAGKKYGFSFHQVSDDRFTGLPQLGGGYGAYYRILIPLMIEAERIVYIDADTLCRLDVSDFYSLDLGGYPAGFVAESTIQSTPDKYLRDLLPQHGEKPYFNSGVMVVERRIWLEKKVTERCFDFLGEHNPQYYDQTTLNYVLFGDWQQLDSRLNFISNWRGNWPFLTKDRGAEGKLIHFLDSPKPWDFGAEYIHPHYDLWRSILDRTAMRDYRSWKSDTQKIPDTAKKWTGYTKALKDKILFFLYKAGVMIPKGVNH